MSTQEIVIVAGLGEVGRPLLDILRQAFDCAGIDVSPVEIDRPCSVLHVCYPYQIPDFIGVTAKYVARYQPHLTIVHSTVAPGITRELRHAIATDSIAYSPVRGKHVRMETDMMRYKKFVAAFSPSVAKEAAEHLGQAGFKTGIFRTPEIAELSKLLETTYLGLLVAWAQEVERFAERSGGSAEEVNEFIKEIDFLPSHIFPGYIGGHCIMPNIEILRAHFDSKFLDAIVESNLLKKQQPVLVAAAR